MKILYLPNSHCQQRQFEKKVNIYPVLMAMECEWHRQNGDEVWWDERPNVWGLGKQIYEPEGLPFLSLPHPDRMFTKAKEYTSGNYKYLPGTHMMSSNSCWYRKCTFCVEKEIKSYELRTVDDVISEIDECVVLNYREIFDDSGTFPIGKWLYDFTTKLNNKVKFSCNMRLDYNHPNLEALKYMKSQGFRMVLYGLESGNQATLDRLNKGININSAIDNIKRSAKAGLSVHLAFMVGYNWETREEAIKTINLVKWLLIKGYAHTAQCSFYTPPNHEGDYRQKDLVKKIYEVGYNPEFWVRRIVNIRNLNDMRYIWKGIKSAFRS